MRTLLKFLAAGIAAAGLASITAVAADQARTQQQLTTQDQARAGYQLEARDRYGWELMSEQERADHAAKMRGAATNEHHELMQERARSHGVALPDMPPDGRGPGMGQGSGQGTGQGGGGGGRR